jgi:glucosamine kinase
LIQNIYIGVDGGGTKSKVRVENEAGEVLGQAMGGPANIRLSAKTSWESILHALRRVLQEAGLTLENPHYHYHIGLGLAGCEVVEAVHEFLSMPHPFKTIELTSDAYVACVGAHQLNDGAIIIVGTGTIGYQIEAGKGVRVSGWGFPHDDEGSGAWLGLEAARSTFQWLDHRAEKSPLVADIFAFFDHDAEKFASWANSANSSEFGRLAPLVINHAQQEEVAAVRLMKKAAHAVDRINAALVKLQTHPETPLPCCLFGGIAPFLEPWLSEELRSRIVTRQADANVGAILMIRDIVVKKSNAHDSY